MISLPPMAHYSGHIAHNESWWVQRALVVDFQLVIVIKSFSNRHANRNANVGLRMGIIYSNSHPAYHVATYPNHMWGADEQSPTYPYLKKNPQELVLTPCEVHNFTLHITSNGATHQEFVCVSYRNVQKIVKVKHWIYGLWFIYSQ